MTTPRSDAAVYCVCAGYLVPPWPGVGCKVTCRSSARGACSGSPCTHQLSLQCCRVTSVRSERTQSPCMWMFLLISVPLHICVSVSSHVGNKGTQSVLNHRWGLYKGLLLFHIYKLFYTWHRRLNTISVVNLGCRHKDRMGRAVCLE